MNWLEWARRVLRALGAPDTANNQAALLTWMAGEQPPGSPNAKFNPLNIQASGYPGQGGITGKSPGGQFNFADAGTGVAQTVAFLSQPRYWGVIASLRTDAPAESTLAAIQTSGWAASGYGGRLPGLLSSVLGNWAQYANGKIAGAGAGSGDVGTAPGPGDVFGNDAGGGDGGFIEQVFRSATRLAVLAVGVAGGIALIVLGARQATSPARQKVEERGEKAAGVAMMATPAGAGAKAAGAAKAAA